MNLPFVLDSIMNSEHGLRPFDMEAFRINDARQPLYAVSSTVRGGKMETVAFNSKEGDFWDIFVDAERDGNDTVPSGVFAGLPLHAGYIPQQNHFSRRYYYQH